MCILERFPSSSPGDHHSKEFEAINMLKTVPVLKEGDFTLIESVAILLYLTRKYRTSIYWYPPDVQLRGLIDEYMAWQHDSIHLKMQKFLWSKLLIPLITGQEMPKEKQDELLGEVNVNVQLFTDHFLKDKPFIAGNIISLADLLAAMEMMQAVGASYNIFMGKPKLNAWRQRVEDSVGARLFEEAHARLLNIKKWDTSFLDPSVKEKIVAMVKNMAK
ncbi:glutathione S-transferase theta-4-like isoform X3 [Monodelphis domestica]|uniref:glutathione S-transferase theta-4-like isoform X3 n=1 Tax=Monodelphis domestica TaxID=13616 RepID=UPI0024E21F69|nr:glutathione S-transferase theta-4-like isoform X3 [Monodelphis domestica]